MVGSRQPEPARPWSAGCLPGVVGGGLTSLATTVAIGRVWAACDVGINASANSFSLLLLGPLIWVAAAVPWVILHGTLGRRHRACALTAGVVISVCLAWLLVVWLGATASPDPACPRLDHLTWWPSDA